jgi:hypothetical protein
MDFALPWRFFFILRKIMKTFRSKRPGCCSAGIEKKPGAGGAGKSKKQNGA